MTASRGRRLHDLSIGFRAPSRGELISIGRIICGRVAGRRPLWRSGLRCRTIRAEISATAIAGLMHDPGKCSNATLRALVRKFNSTPKKSAWIGGRKSRSRWRNCARLADKVAGSQSGQPLYFHRQGAASLLLFSTAAVSVRRRPPRQSPRRCARANRIVDRVGEVGLPPPPPAIALLASLIDQPAAWARIHDGAGAPGQGGIRPGETSATRQLHASIVQSPMLQRNSRKRGCRQADRNTCALAGCGLRGW